MMGTQRKVDQHTLFSYGFSLERRVSPDHDLRKLAGVLDLEYVLPAVASCYGRSGNPSLDPRVIVKMMLLLFYYNIPSERELMEQIRVRLDFLWFLGLDLESTVPDHSVLSKARARWGAEVFKKIFERTVVQCVQAGLVDGRLLHIDSTMVKANASKSSVVSSSPELVQALRQAYQEQEAKLEVLPAPAPDKSGDCAKPEPPSPAPAPAPKIDPEEIIALLPDPVPSALEPEQIAPAQSEAKTLDLQVLPAAPGEPAEQNQPTAKAKKLPVNSTHISTTDPEAELARSKNGVTELNFKDHRLVDDTHGVITAVLTTNANVADGTQLPALVEQHCSTTQLNVAAPNIAGDGHYGTASNLLFCMEQGIHPHLSLSKANLEERGHLSLNQFIYEPEQDRLRCPQGHYLKFHQNRPEEKAKVYLIEDPAQCASCPLKSQCTKSAQGRSIQRHMEADLVRAAQEEATSPQAKISRKRRQHVMEGSFADAANNHGLKRARWRGMWRQEIQSCLIAAVQNLRILIRRGLHRPGSGAVALAGAEARSSGASLPAFCTWSVPRCCRRSGFLGSLWGSRQPESLLSWSIGH
jgi:transposase